MGRRERRRAYEVFAFEVYGPGSGGGGLSMMRLLQSWAHDPSTAELGSDLVNYTKLDDGRIRVSHDWEEEHEVVLDREDFLVALASFSAYLKRVRNGSRTLDVVSPVAAGAHAPDVHDLLRDPPAELRQWDWFAPQRPLS